MENEFRYKLKWMATRLKVDADDLFDWYKKDIVDIAGMGGDTLGKIVREYLSMKTYYRKGNL